MWLIAVPLMQESSAAYLSDLGDLMSMYEPSQWLHGHLHNSSDYMVDNTRMVFNPRGYPDERNPDFRVDLVSEVFV